jgi:RNA polymerase sigma-70 factor (ECF subfamily)
MHDSSQDIRPWLTEARHGSRDALGKALEFCRRYLLRVAYLQMNRDLQAKGDASDLVQETFLDAQRSFDRFQGDSEPELRAWLCQLLHYRVAKFRRKYLTTSKRQLARETALTAASQRACSTAEDTSPGARLMADEQAQRLLQALECLPDDYRQAISMRYAEQCSFEEIGRRMHRTPN